MCYEGATGGGTCSWDVVGRTTAEAPGPTGPLTVEIDCALRVSTGGARWAKAPLSVGLAPIPNRVALFGSPGDLPTTVEVLVPYWNGGDEPLTGLSLRLLPPEGTEIVTAAQAEEEPASGGDQVWALPDLALGGELRRFQFQLQFLAAERGSVPLAVEIDVEGFEEPVRSEPVTIEVVQ